jgi:cold shock CspA family protein
MLGKITRILESKGFGFIWSTIEEKHFFFHRDTISPDSPLTFDKLKVGNTVSFEPSTKIVSGNEKGRAENVIYLN